MIVFNHACDARMADGSVKHFEANETVDETTVDQGWANAALMHQFCSTVAPAAASPTAKAGVPADVAAKLAAATK